MISYDIMLAAICLLFLLLFCACWIILEQMDEKRILKTKIRKLKKAH